MPAKLKLSPSFEPCPFEDGEEAFSNGIFEFNITRMMAFVEAHPARFPWETVEVESVPNYGDDESLDQATIATADLSRPILFAEIAPGHYNLIDGKHRLARARRDGVTTLPAYRVQSPHHVAYLTSLRAYQTYVEYWNGKLQDMQPRRRRVPVHPHDAPLGEPEYARPSTSGHSMRVPLTFGQLMQVVALFEVCVVVGGCVPVPLASIVYEPLPWARRWTSRTATIWMLRSKVQTQL